MSSAAWPQSSCPIYATGFDAFSGPPDFTQGQFSVQWCLNGASVTGSNFCPTGNALKLDSSTDDPVVLVRVGNAGCSSVTITFIYAQFAATGTTLKAGLTNATTVSCTGSTPTTLGVLSTTGGICTQVTLTALVSGSQGVLFRFDHGNTGATAITIDDLTVSVTGCCFETHTCCETGPAGCADDVISACVCAVDPFCCETQWDAQCVGEVEALGCGDCGTGGGTPNCADALQTNFGTLYSTASVCSLFPEIFESCEGAAPTLTISGLCASSADPAMRFGVGFPYSSAITRCLDLTAMPAPTLRFKWSRNQGSLGPRLDYRLADGAWTLAWQPTTGQGTTNCIETVIDLAPLSGGAEVRFRFVSGSSVSNGATIDDILLDPGQPPHDCCTIGGPSCTVASVASCVCAADPYCCVTAWDAACVSLATTTCAAGCTGVLVCGAPDAGDCLVAHPSPFCADAACCSSVCSLDLYCCATAWDATCAVEAAGVCAASSCGPGAQSCFVAHLAPSCDDPTCCTAVCIPDPVCCLVAWDALCVAEAMNACAAPPSADLDGDGAVNGADLAKLLASWGATGSGIGSDLDLSGSVDAADLAILLSAWTTG
ncbi:MAG: hypothetical protein SGJ09_13990 [Phycisphaerae bacterium]|nr:hypothetical protein [Phycisphaerae bacterium]